MSDDRRLRAAIGLLALAGAAVSAYLVYTRYTGTTIVCSTLKDPFVPCSTCSMPTP